MVATVDGTRLLCAPIKNDELADAVVDLVTRLGEPIRVEVCHADGMVRRAVIDPANPKVSRLMRRGRRAPIGSRPGARAWIRLETVCFLLALSLAVVSIFLLG